MFILPYFYRVISEGGTRGVSEATSSTTQTSGARKSGATTNTTSPATTTPPAQIQNTRTATAKEDSSRVIQFSVLTLSGTALWKEEDTLDVIKEVLEPNGLFLSGSPILHNGIYYCPVDLTRTDTSDDYHWEEIDPAQGGQFCWRTFYQCEPYRLSPPASERLEPFSCREVLDHLMTLATG